MLIHQRDNFASLPKVRRTGGTLYILKGVSDQQSRVGNRGWNPFGRHVKSVWGSCRMPEYSLASLASSWRCDVPPPGGRDLFSSYIQTPDRKAEGTTYSDNDVILAVGR